MEENGFLVPPDDNLTRLIADIPSEPIIKSEEIKDDDILFFSHFGTLPNTPNDSNDFQIMSQMEIPNPSIAGNGISLSPDVLFPKLPSLDIEFDMNDLKFDSSIAHYIKYKEIDGKPIKIWGCGLCHKEFGHQYTLVRHLPTHTDERKFHCNICGKAFRQMSTLSQHRAIHSSERPYVCEICQKNFNRVSTLISHRKTHTGLKPHQCHLCKKAFHQKGNLRNHIFTHTNERPYKCEVCEKGFNQMSNLMCHKLKMHQQSEVPKYVCKICGKDFLKRVSLRNHEQCKHGVPSPTSESAVPTKTNSDGIIVEPIKTEAMQLALAANETPFALLRPLSGIPVLVRVLPAGDKQMLVPATAEDLKKYGQISILPKEVDQTSDNSLGTNSKSGGSVVQIKVPVVATVIQKPGSQIGDRMSLSVISPGPNSSASGHESDSYMYTTTLTSGGELPTQGINNNALFYENNTNINGFVNLLEDDRF